MQCSPDRRQNTKLLTPSVAFTIHIRRTESSSSSPSSLATVWRPWNPRIILVCWDACVCLFVCTYFVHTYVSTKLIAAREFTSWIYKMQLRYQYDSKIASRSFSLFLSVYAITSILYSSTKDNMYVAKNWRNFFIKSTEGTHYVLKCQDEI